MKVLHLVGAAEDNGGILTTLRGLASADGGMGAAVWVNRTFTEVRHPPLDYRRSKHALDESRNHLRLAWRALRSFGELQELLRVEPYQILHAHSRGAFLVALLAAARLRRPVVFTNHTYARRIGLYRWGARRPGIATVLLTPNMARHYGLMPGPGRIELIPEACADSCFSLPLRSEANREPGLIRLIGIGNLVRWKRWDLLLHALAALPVETRGRLRLEIWGPTPDDPDSRDFANALNELIRDRRLTDAARLRGPTNSVTEHLATADWFVLPSTNEPCSLALLEALAQGLPALVSSSGGNVDIVRDGTNGLLFEPDDCPSLSRRLEELANGRRIASAPAEIRESTRPYAASSVARAYDKLYRRLIEPNHSRNEISG